MRKRNARIDSILFAKYVLNRAFDKDIEVGPTKFQRILYAIDIDLLINDINLIDENCRAFEYGPVYPEVLLYFKHRDERICNGKFDSYNRKYKENFSSIKKDKRIKSINESIDYILDKCKDFTTGELVSWSMEEGAPWSMVYDPKEPRKIEKTLMKRYYSQFIIE